MLRDTLALAIRQLRWNKLFSSINILGLGIGVAVGLFILLFVADELSYDRFHHEVDDVYRVVTEFVSPDGRQVVNLTPNPLGPAISRELPEVAAVVRFRRVFRSNPLFEFAENRFYEDGFWASDPDFFEVFDFELVRGDEKTALNEPNSLLLTETMVTKYFGDEDPMGKVLTLEGTMDFRITGVLKDIPRNSHFKFDSVTSFSTLAAMPGKQLDNWYAYNSRTYLRSQPRVKQELVQDRLPALRKKYLGEDAEDYAFHLQPLTDIHLHSDVLYEFEANGDARTVLVFAAAALLILILASANFTNLAIARSARRSTEIGVRKTAGATRWELVGQFLSESFAEVLLAMVTGLVIVILALPFYESIFDRGIELGSLVINPNLLLLITALIAAITFTSVFYPALVLSGLQPVKVLRGAGISLPGSTLLRKLLVVLQFAIAIALMVGTFFVYRQIAFLQDKPLGYEKRGLIVINFPQESIQSYKLVRDQLAALREVISAGTSSNAPGGNVSQFAFRPEGSDSSENSLLSVLHVDEKLVETLGVRVIDGRSFSELFEADPEESLVINQAAAQHFGWVDPIGKNLILDGPSEAETGRIIGVIDNFHFRSLREEIGPLVLRIKVDRFRKMLLRINPEQPAKSLAVIRTRWQELLPGRPLDYSFLDADFNEQFRGDARVGRLGLWFSIIALFIASLGLFGLSAYTVQRRRREIGIRKAHGASTRDIVVLVSREFLSLVVIGSLVAWPIAFIAVQRWLEDFPYRIAVTPGVFVIAFLTALLVAAIAVTMWALAAAKLPPVEALRQE